MARIEQRRFGNFLLDSTNGIYLSRWGARGLRSTRFDPRIGGAGANVREDRGTGHRIDFQGFLRGSDTEDTSVKLGALLSRLNSGEDFLYLYSDREISARLNGEVKYSLAPGSEGRIYDISFSFMSRSPYWRGVTETTDQFTRSGAGPHNVTTSIPNGTAPSLPKIKITNTGAAFTDKVLTLTNTSSGEQIQLIGISLGNGDQITIDMEEGFIGDGSSIPINPFAIDGLFFSIAADAATILELEHNVGAGASWILDVTFHPLHWSE